MATVRLPRLGVISASRGLFDHRPDNIIGLALAERVEGKRFLVIAKMVVRERDEVDEQIGQRIVRA